jgi:hypothetical protein
VGYAFCLRLDPAAEASVAALWQGLVDGGAGEEMLRLNYPPHLSLAVLDVEPALAIVQAAFDAACDTPMLAVQLGSAKRFPETEIVWLAVDGGEGLAGLHRRLLAHLPDAQVREHYRIGHWTPHVTLQMSGDAGSALALAGVVWPTPMAARIIGLDLVQFSPVRVVKSVALV